MRHYLVFFSIPVFRPSLPRPVGFAAVDDLPTALLSFQAALAAAAAFVDLFHYPVVAETPSRCWAIALHAPILRHSAQRNGSKDTVYSALGRNIGNAPPRHPPTAT